MPDAPDEVLADEDAKKKRRAKSSSWKGLAAAGLGAALAGGALLWYFLRRRGDGGDDAGNGECGAAATPVPAIEDEEPPSEGRVIMTHMRVWWVRQLLRTLTRGASLEDVSKLFIKFAVHARGRDCPRRNTAVTGRGYSAAFADLITRLAHQLEYGYDDATTEAFVAHMGAYVESLYGRSEEAASMRVALHALLTDDASLARVMTGKFGEWFDRKVAAIQKDSNSWRRDVTYSEVGLAAALNIMLEASIKRMLPVPTRALRKELLEQTVSGLGVARTYLETYDMYRIMPPSIGAYLQRMHDDCIAEIDAISGGNGGAPSGGGGGGHAKYVTTSGVVVEDHTRSALDVHTGARTMLMHSGVWQLHAALLGAVHFMAPVPAMTR